ncbi:universal stress protein [Isoptericola sp. NPDC019693]|uniref:universal stress protein n=1 Tax=Isoptericola sp. NPDC019693 TaxID=3364009 RepID=UPI003792D9FE
MSAPDPRAIARLRSRLPSRDEPAGPVLLALDDSPSSHLPVQWAAAEAAARATVLRVVRSVATPPPVVAPTTPWGTWYPWTSDDDRSPVAAAWDAARADLEEVVRQAHAVDPRLDIATALTPAGAAGAHGDAADTLQVVGRRRRPRALGGAAPAAARRTARRTGRPVAVVALAGSSQPGPSAHRVVVALRPGADPTAVLDVAFRAAARRRVGVTVLHVPGRDLPATVDAEILAEVLDPYDQVFPDVDVRARQAPALARAVVQESVGAVLTVVDAPSPRDVRGSALARRVLARARGTVVLVPPARPARRVSVR